ncbi:NADH-quinone oxidoreductase subunit M [bacterium]|nr:NADH-quinone oxidoreductase subunit M [bacterium]
MDPINTAMLIFWPAIFAFLLFTFRKNKKAAQWANMVFHLPWFWFLYQSCLLWRSSTADGMFPIVFNSDFFPLLKSNFALGLDGLNLPLIGLNVFLSFCLSLYALGKEKLSSSYLALFALLNAASVGSLMAADAFVFYIFWEAMLIPMFFLIGIWGSKNRVYAALKFFAFTMLGSLAMLAAILYLWVQPDIQSMGWHSIAQLGLLGDGLWSPRFWVFCGFLIAFLVKIPAWPLHVWLPDAHTEAPTGASVILAGVLLKLGVYGIARWCLALFPSIAVLDVVSFTMKVLALAGIILGSYGALRQTDIKRTIAYSSVAHLGFMLLGLFSFQLAGFQGAMFQNIAHGLSTGALFLIFGIIYDRTHTRELSDYGGLGIVNPRLSMLFVLSVMASIGLPGLPGFIGEFLILNGTFVLSPWFAFFACFGILLGAVYMLRIVRGMIYGETSSVLKSHPIKLSFSEWGSIIPMIIAMIVLGFWGQGLIAVTARASATIIYNLQGEILR